MKMKQLIALLSCLFFLTVSVSAQQFIQLKNRWKKDGKTTYYLHNQNGKLEAGAIIQGWWSAQWKLVKVGGTNFYRIQNRWKPNEYIHTQGPQLASGAIDNNWWSAQWDLEGYKGATNSKPTTKPTTNPTRKPITGVGFGAVPTKPENLQPVRKIRSMATPSGSAAGGTARKVLSLDMPPIGQQGREGSCVAWACAYAVKSFEMKGATRMDYTIGSTDVLNPMGVASPEYLFNRINLNNNDCSVGSYFVGFDKNRGALDVLKSEGVAPWALAPYSDTNGCGTVENAKEPVSPLAGQNKIKNYARVYDLSKNSLKTLLNKQHPIIFSANPSDGFMSAGPDFVWTSGIGPATRGHAMVIMGYDDTKQAYKVQNSWGTGWGDNGYTWLGYEHAKSAINEAYVTYSDNLDNFRIEIPGYVTVYSEAGYVAWIKLSYTMANGTRKVVEENLSLFFTFRQMIPPGATNIELEVGGYAVLDQLDFKKSFNTSNVQQCYKLWGTIFDTEYGLVDCSY